MRRKATSHGANTKVPNQSQLPHTSRTLTGSLPVSASKGLLRRFERHEQITTIVHAQPKATEVPHPCPRLKLTRPKNRPNPFDYMKFLCRGFSGCMGSPEVARKGDISPRSRMLVSDRMKIMFSINRPLVACSLATGIC